MRKKLTIALAQVNVTVGDIEGNLKIILDCWKKSRKADLVVFPELATTGYPAEDLVLNPVFQQQAMSAMKELAKKTAKGPAILVGGLWVTKDGLHNAAYLLEKGKIVHIQPKHELPNYGVFDEKRHFTKGPLPAPINFKGIKLGILVCEDTWHPNVPNALKGCDIAISINASPFELDKIERRHAAIKRAAGRLSCPIVYVNEICGQDDTVFDGGSLVMDAKGQIKGYAGQFRQTLTTAVFEKKAKGWQCTSAPKGKPLAANEQHYQALMLGLKDYVEKNNFKGVVLGLSGGIDSAISAAIAVDALGAKKVKTFMLPSRYTSEESLADAAECARRLGISLEELSIEEMVQAAESTLSGVFAGQKKDIAEENIQSRIRGLLLMAYSNKFGYMLLSTGNKSELSVGYATLYGDMAGGYNAIKDTYKMQVFALSKWRNKNFPEGALGPKGNVIPANIITKAPTAELRHNQKDEDSLPPYDVLDGILDGLIEKELSLKDIVKKGYKKQVVEKVAELVYKAEYKRRQSAPGVKVTQRSFGRDRRYPVTSRFKEN